MKERPIIFGAESVRAILAGTKTQTRRIISLGRGMEAVNEDNDFEMDGCPDWPHAICSRTSCLAPLDCPYGVPGDRLWVREAWRVSDTAMLTMPHAPSSVHFRADQDECSGGPWRSSIHMPRWASRITLELTDVRVQRVQDIGEEDARAEGITEDYPEIECNSARPFRDGYAYVWDQINGKRAPWESNPWVWCLTFRRLP